MSLATFLRLGLALELVVGLLLAMALLPASARGWAPALALSVPFIVIGIALFIQVTVAQLVDPRSPTPTFARLLSAWWDETRISSRAFIFVQPFMASFPEPPLVADPQRPAVLLIHGYICNRAVWRRLLASGELAGCNVATVNLEPVFGSIDRYAAVVHDAVATLRAATGAQRVTLLAHSMGGLAARVYLRDYGDAAVERVITVATPHAGTVFGHYGVGPNGRQMATGSAFLEALATATAPHAHKFLCVASRDDNLVVPRTSPLLPGAQHVIFERAGHLQLIEDRRMWQVVRGAVLQQSPTPAAENGSALRQATRRA